MTEAERRAAEADIEKLIRRYALLNDANEWDALAALYTEDGRFARPSAPDDWIAGREAILAGFTARPARKSRHVVSNVVVDLAGPEAARAFSVIVLFMGDSQEAGLPKMAANAPFVGYFEDRLVRTADGWRFAERRGGLDFAP